MDFVSKRGYQEILDRYDTALHRMVMGSRSWVLPGTRLPWSMAMAMGMGMAVHATIQTSSKVITVMRVCRALNVIQTSVLVPLEVRCEREMQVRSEK